MKKLLILLLASITFVLSGCKAQDPVVKEAMLIEDQLMFDKAVEALERQDFVLEVDNIRGRSGKGVAVSSRTNFLSVDGKRAIVQIIVDGLDAGQTGVMKGIAIEGTASNIKMKTDKKGNVSFTMNVTSTFGRPTSAKVDIKMNATSNWCVATVILANSSKIRSFSGYLYPKNESSVIERKKV